MVHDQRFAAGDQCADFFAAVPLAIIDVVLRQVLQDQVPQLLVESFAGVEGQQLLEGLGRGFRVAVVAAVGG
jgi:hypothetical protein